MHSAGFSSHRTGYVAGLAALAVQLPVATPQPAK